MGITMVITSISWDMAPLELSLYIVIHVLVKLHPQVQSIIIPKRFNGRNMARVCAFDVI